MLVAPRSATRTWPASARNVSWRGGRPPVLGPNLTSTTRPSSISSPTRWATTPRLRPVRATSSERERDRAKPDLVEDRDERVERLARPPTASRDSPRRSYALGPTFALDMQKYDQSVQSPGPLPRTRCRGREARSEIGAAVIGSGFIGTVHIEALRRLGVHVHGLLGSSPERGAERAGSSASRGPTTASTSCSTTSASRSSTSPRPTTSTTRRSARSSRPAATSCARSRWR